VELQREDALVPALGLPISGTLEPLANRRHLVGSAS
jgi:hypothetical protein